MSGVDTVEVDVRNRAHCVTSGHERAGRARPVSSGRIGVAGRTRVSPGSRRWARARGRRRQLHDRSNGRRAGEGDRRELRDSVACCSGVGCNNEGRSRHRRERVTDDHDAGAARTARSLATSRGGVIAIRTTATTTTKVVGSGDAVGHRARRTIPRGSATSATTSRRTRSTSCRCAARVATRPATTSATTRVGDTRPGNGRGASATAGTTGRHRCRTRCSCATATATTPVARSTKVRLTSDATDVRVRSTTRATSGVATVCTIAVYSTSGTPIRRQSRAALHETRGSTRRAGSRRRRRSSVSTGTDRDGVSCARHHCVVGGLHIATGTSTTRTARSTSTSTTDDKKVDARDSLRHDP